MNKDLNLKFLAVQVYCENHERNEPTRIYSSTPLISYVGKFDVDFFNTYVSKSTPKNICCKKCKSTQHNALSYSFSHTEKITGLKK